MDTEDVELVVTAVILLRRVRKRRLKKPGKLWALAIFKEGGEKRAYHQLTNDMQMNDREFYFK